MFGSKSACRVIGGSSSRDSSFVFVLKTKEYKKNDLMCVLDLIVNKDRLVQ